MQKELSSEINKKVDTTQFEKLQTSLEKNDVPNTYKMNMQDYFSKALTRLKYADTSVKSNDIYYSLFEMAFYDHDYIIKKQKIYLPYILNDTKTKFHLDIGCGRGEFLSILKENDIKSKGVDINSVEINALKNLAYDVELSDGVSYLKSSDENFSSISAFQVIEHLDYEYLKELVLLSYQRLEKNGTIILETICPYNPVTINSFYMDETHKRLIPPELITFILQWAGFKDVKMLLSSPLPKELIFKDDILRSYHDYAVIGYKK